MIKFPISYTLMPLLLLFASWAKEINPLQQSEGKLKVWQYGRQLHLHYPALRHRSAVKITDLNGQLIKGILADEQTTALMITLERYNKGIHLVTLENREQVYKAKVLLR